MSPVSLFGRRRRAQIRTRSLSEPRSGSIRYEIHFHNPKSQRPAYHRAALRVTFALASLDLGLFLGRPFATKTINKQDWLGHNALIPPDQFQYDNENRTSTPRQQCPPRNHASARHVP